MRKLSIAWVKKKILIIGKNIKVKKLKCTISIQSLREPETISHVWSSKNLTNKVIYAKLWFRLRVHETTEARQGFAKQNHKYQI